MDAVSILGSFCILSAIITYGLGVFVYAKNPGSKVNFLFLLVNIGASYWAVGEFLIWHQNSYENVFFWLKASSFWTIVIVLCIHFLLTFADHPLTKSGRFHYLALILYIPAFILAIVNITSEHIFSVDYSPESRYYYLPSFGDPIYICATVYFLIILFWSVYVGFQSRKSAGDDKFKRQASSISTGLLIVIGFGSQSVIILPMFGIYIPNLVFIGIVLFSIAISYAILKYGLFVLSPETVATNIIQTMPDGLILTDMNGRVITTNKKATILLSGTWEENPGTFHGTPIPEPAYSTILETIKTKKGISDFEVIPDKNEITTMSVSGSLVTDPYDKPAGMILIIRDITERKFSEKALKLANEKISQLNKLTRHDISNLVTAISGYLEIIKQEKDEETRKKVLNTCIDLIGKVTRHLHFSRDYQNVGIHEPRWQSLNHMISKAIEDINHDEIEITVSLLPADIFADPLSVKVIYNLLENAIRHATGLTHISIISKEQQDGSLLIIIEDNGPGIKPEEKEKIFKQGYGKNTGLGLTLAREILAVTQITITETGTFGIGARFEITIPSGTWRYAHLHSHEGHGPEPFQIIHKGSNP